MSRNRNCRITTAVRKNPIPNLCNIGHVVSSIETHLVNPRGPTSKLGEQYAMLQSGDCWKHFRMNSKIYRNMRQTSHNTSKLAWLKDVLVSTGCPLPTSLLFNIIALYSAISANPPQPNCQDTPEQYGAGTIHMLNKSIRGKEKKAVAKQRNNSMPVTILPSLCGSRMCWSAQDVLCQQVYFSTSLPSILPSQQILPNLIVKTLQNNMEQAQFTCSTSLSEGKKRKPWPNKETTACQLQYFQACVAQGCVGQHRMSSANKFTFQHHCPQFCHLCKFSPT